MVLGNTLREVRERRGESLRQVARAVGIHPSYLSRIELGERNCPDELKVALAEHYRVELTRLFFQSAVA